MAIVVVVVVVVVVAGGGDGDGDGVRVCDVVCVCMPRKRVLKLQGVCMVQIPGMRRGRAQHAGL